MWHSGHVIRCHHAHGSTPTFAPGTRRVHPRVVPRHPPGDSARWWRHRRRGWVLADLLDGRGPAGGIGGQGGGPLLGVRGEHRSRTPGWSTRASLGSLRCDRTPGVAMLSAR
jgi:hypothetical protein